LPAPAPNFNVQPPHAGNACDDGDGSPVESGRAIHIDPVVVSPSPSEQQEEEEEEEEEEPQTLCHLIRILYGRRRRFIQLQ
jgi:hypothetical protein